MFVLTVYRRCVARTAHCMRGGDSGVNGARFLDDMHFVTGILTSLLGFTLGIDIEILPNDRWRRLHD